MDNKKAHKKYSDAQNEAQDYDNPFSDERQGAQDECIIPMDDELPSIDLDAVSQDIEEEKPKTLKEIEAEAREAHLRALADMENYKKRLAREHEEQIAYAAEKVLASLLPSLDNLDLALQYGNMEACKDLAMGVEMTRKLLLDAVKVHGLEPVGEVGEAFTPELHEALTFEQRDDMEENHVSTVMQKGYKLKNRLLRPAKVGISKK